MGRNDVWHVTLVDEATGRELASYEVASGDVDTNHAQKWADENGQDYYSMIVYYERPVTSTD